MKKIYVDLDGLSRISKNIKETYLWNFKEIEFSWETIQMGGVRLQSEKVEHLGMAN